MSMRAHYVRFFNSLLMKTRLFQLAGSAEPRLPGFLVSEDAFPQKIDRCAKEFLARGGFTVSKTTVVH